MRVIRVCVVVAALCSGALGPSHAQDASLGCKVLLCAAATSPGWHGIPYCVPVMNRLFSILRRGGAWPSCPEGNAGALGYEPYEPCPDGSHEAGFIEQGDVQSSLQPRLPHGDLCARPNPNAGRCSGGGETSACEPEYLTQSRMRRAEPHFVDITTANGTQRFRFSLQ